MTDGTRGASRNSPGRAVPPLLAGFALLIAFGVMACRAEPPPDVGGPSVGALSSASPSGPPASSVAIDDGALPTAAADRGPARLRIPALRLDAAVSPVGVDPRTGDFDVPPSIDRVGWYRYGPGVTATAGSIVIAGHVDSATQGAGAFFRLGALSPGDRVYADDREFRVIGRERYRKSRIPLDRYFARDGALRLTLITCGGPFDAATGHYRDNVVVTASPVR
jgi:hypothetical protein